MKRLMRAIADSIAYLSSLFRRRPGRQGVILRLCAALTIWFVHSAQAMSPTPPIISLAEKVERSDAVALTQVAGAVCIDIRLQRTREASVCEGSERLYLRLTVDEFLCIRDKGPVEPVIYLPAWHYYTSVSDPKVPIGERQVVFVKRQFSSGPFAGTVFAHTSSILPEHFSSAKSAKDISIDICRR